MVADDEDSLICDFAQYYHVLSWRALPLSLSATLAAGLPPESRCMQKLSGLNCSPELLFMARISDDLHRWLWWHSKEGQDGTNQPVSLLDQLFGRKKERMCRGFESGEAFMAALRAFETTPRGDMRG